jgi:hypothetical protein
MIDDKKIEEAADKYVKETCTEDMSPVTKVTAEMSFHKGINWFLGNLWHGFDEVPRNDYSQVVLIRGNNQALPTILDMNELMDNSEWEGDYECIWKGIVKTHHIKKWFYIEDLLTKEGGDHD